MGAPIFVLSITLVCNYINNLFFPDSMFSKRFCVLLTISALVMSACIRKQERKTIHYLTAGKTKYWIEVKPYPTKKYLGLKFETNGKCDEYVISNKAKNRFKVVSPSYDPKWEIVNDSTLYIGWVGNVRIEYIDDNVMVLNSIKQRRVIVYLKDEDQNTELMKDTFDHSMDM